MARGLQAPEGDDSDWSELYTARGADVAGHRPIFTGDVFTGVPLRSPLGDEKTRSVLVLQHPCAMRPDGVNLAESLLVARLSNFPLLRRQSWDTNGRLMPLPDLMPDVVSGKRHQAAFFDNTYHVHPSQLDLTKRVACLSEAGVYLLLQRWVFHSSRVVVPTFDFESMNSHVFTEADIVEEWCEEALVYDVPIDQAAQDAAAWLSDEVGGVTRREALQTTARQSEIRRAAKKAVEALYSPGGEVIDLPSTAP